MKRILLSIVLAAALVFVLSGSALAVPPAGEQAGSFFVFGEAVPFQYNGGPFGAYAFSIGAGYAISDSFALGLTYQSYPGFNFFGGFADLALGPVSLTGEFFIGAFNDGWYKLTGLYMIDLDPFTLGLGGGLQGVVNPDSSALFLEGYASIAVSDNFSIYGSVDYWFAGYATASAGLSLAF